jgi:hypothetical protein
VASQLAERTRDSGSDVTFVTASQLIVQRETNPVVSSQNDKTAYIQKMVEIVTLKDASGNRHTNNPRVTGVRNAGIPEQQ